MNYKKSFNFSFFFRPFRTSFSVKISSNVFLLSTQFVQTCHIKKESWFVEGQLYMYAKSFYILPRCFLLVSRFYVFLVLTTNESYCVFPYVHSFDFISCDSWKNHHWFFFPIYFFLKVYFKSHLTYGIYLFTSQVTLYFCSR